MESTIKWSTIKQGLPADWKKQHGTMTYQNLWDVDKIVLKREFITFSVTSKKMKTQDE